MGESEAPSAKPDAAEPEAPAGDGAPAPAGAETEAAPETAPAGEGASKPKKRKKRKRAPAAETRDPIGPDGRERPAFVLDYPSDPELDRLVRAFEVGNYAFVREHAPELAQKGSDARVRAAASELARRIEPDPLVKTLLLMSIALFVVLALWAYKTHGN